MAAQKKTLLIISLDRKVTNFLRAIIHNIIGSEVKVYGQSLEEGLLKPIPTDVVMTSGAFLVPRVRAIYPDAVIIAPTRLITGYNLEKVLMLPRGTKVLVVNDPRSATENTIESLRNIGITHIDYVPYWRGSRRDYREIGTAVSPGMLHLCPVKIPNLIDIGPRIISIHSFFRLLVALDLDPGYLENYATYTHNFLMESSRKLAAVLEHSELLRKYQEVILDQFEDGLLSANDAGDIDIANKSAARLLRTSTEALLSSNIYELLSVFKHTTNLMDESHEDFRTSSIYEYDSKQVLIQKIPVTSENVVRHIYTFREIARIQRLEKDVRLRLARKGYITKYSFDEIWTNSRVIRELKDKALSFATTEKNILITGESGTGKELFAHAIHGSSPRREGPFVAVNFAGIPEGLIESELFGYDPGAFTGAKKSGKTGYFEQAHGGTIFLDEIGDAPLNVQSRLLRVLQEKEIMKVGGSGITPVDVRIIAGTNRNLNEAMQEGKFRKDLYYRLNTLPLEIPPLRDHKEDILYLLDRYLTERYGIHRDFSPAAVECFMRYGWPGNKRELINLAEYICISARSTGVVEPEHLPGSLADILIIQPGRESKEEDSHRVIMEDLVRSSAPLEPLLCVLSTLRLRRRSLNGRKSLMKELLHHNHFVTEGRMKTYLKILRHAGLIHVGSTKQGTALTEKGESFLNFLISGDRVPPGFMSCR